MTVGGTLLRRENQRYSFSAGEWWEKGKTTPNQYYNFDLTYYESGVDHFVLKQPMSISCIPAGGAAAIP